MDKLVPRRNEAFKPREDNPNYNPNFEVNKAWDQSRSLVNSKGDGI